MQPEDKDRLLKYLYDALAAAQTIEMDTLGLGPGQFRFNNIKWIAERGIEIISEALKRACVIKPDLPISNLQKIFSTRNKIAHEYDLVDPNLLYNIVVKHIPILIEELKDLIQKTEAE